MNKPIFMRKKNQCPECLELFWSPFYLVGCKDHNSYPMNSVVQPVYFKDKKENIAFPETYTYSKEDF